MIQGSGFRGWGFGSRARVNGGEAAREVGGGLSNVGATLIVNTSLRFIRGALYHNETRNLEP